VLFSKAKIEEGIIIHKETSWPYSTPTGKNQNAPRSCVGRLIFGRAFGAQAAE
jgi:hypothetical protein